MNSEIHFEEVYKEFYPKILGYIARLSSADEAEDLAQEVFAKVNRNLDNFKGESGISTWLYRIATNTAIDKFRSASYKRSTESASFDDALGIEDQNTLIGHRKSPTDQTVIRKEMSECVREFIDRLPTDYKTVILLSDLEGFKNREIADILQVSLDTVKIRLHRARARLKEALNEGCDFYHDERNTLACDRKQVQIMPKAPK